MELGKLSS